jgi:hypothetical protein
MNSLRMLIAVVALGLFVGTAGVRAADWKEPKDGVYTEKQLSNYLAVQKEAIASWKAAGKAVEGASSAAALAVALRTDEKFKANLAKHGMGQDEYSWVGGKAFEAWGTLLRQRIAEKTEKDLATQTTEKQKALNELKQKLATYEKAQKEGRRVMTKEERESAVKSAKDEQQAALDEAKQHADEARQAHDEAAKADADAKAADAAAKNPPKDVSDDDKPGFIEQKKNDAQSARDAAKEARDKEAEAKKAETESKTKADAAGKRAANPDVPVSDEEKAEVKKQNEEMVTQVNDEIRSNEEGLKLLHESGDSIIKSFKADDGKVPKQNVELLKKHLKEFQDAWGIKDEELK